TAQRAGRSRLMVRELLDNVDRVERARTLPLAGFVETCRELVVAAQADGSLRHADPLVVLAQIFGAISYAQIVRPTFARITGAKLAADDRRWLAAVVADVERTLLAEV